MNEAPKGSQKWVQVLVNRHPEQFREAIIKQAGLPESITIEWISPRAKEQYREYRDREALRKAEVNSYVDLYSFWPKGGPVQDALAIVDSQVPLFLEAKAHINELGSPGTKARPEPKKLIEASLSEAKKYYGVHDAYDWSGLFYQYANRLAHHYYIEKLNEIPSYLVFLYFLNATEMNGPATVNEWQSAIQVMKMVMGIGKKHFRNVFDIYIDCKGL